MRRSTRVWRLADLPSLLLAMAPLLAGRALGASMDSAGMLALPTMLVFLLVYLGFEAAYLASVVRAAPTAIPASGAIAFALRIQVQVAMQLLTRGAVALLFIYVFDELVSARGRDDDIAAASSHWPLVLVLAQVGIVASISIAWWRCLSLKRHGADMGALMTGSFDERRLALAGRSDAVAVALERHVERLMGKMTPRFSRMFYQADVGVVRTLDGGRPSYAISWALLPVCVTLTPVASGANGTELRIHCTLRGGIHRLELFPNPLIVLAVLRYLQANLLEPLASELSLALAVRKQDELRHQAVESQLRILQAQIEPHFLFNTLASVRHLYRSSVDEGESMMNHLIVYLRSTLEELRSDVSTVSKEMDLVLHYLAIMKIRMGERLSYSFINADDVAQMAFPPAMLISLVENAIMHGLNNRPDGKLTVSAAREAQHLRVTVLDNGAGFSSVQGSGVGLSNIRQRLEAIYGTRAWLEVGAVASGGFMASIIIPIPESA